MGNMCAQCRGQGNDVTVANLGGAGGESTIDKMLAAEAVKEALHFKILTLGAGESGQSLARKMLFYPRPRARFARKCVARTPGAARWSVRSLDPTQDRRSK